MRNPSRLMILAGVLASALAAPAAAESRSFVVNWFYPAMYSVKDDCAGGNNLSAEKLFERILKDQKTPPAEIEKLLADFPNSFSGKYSNRAIIGGKPANAYLNPTGVPDPNIKTATGKIGYGFNLDGKVGANDFSDPETGEKGVDNMAARAMGCFSTMRGGSKERAVHLAAHWAETRDQMQAWLIEISGIDNPQNDDDVTVSLFRAIEPAQRDVNTEAQADVTFRASMDQRSWNVVHGRIKDGLLTTDTFDFRMICDPYFMPDVKFRAAKMRLKLQPDGGAKGVIGGYMPFVDIYMAWALIGTLAESMLSIDLPGFYYALRKLADGRADPRTGINLEISTTFAIEAVPAFILHPETTKVSQATP